jgi:hypothetical protein
MATEAIVLPTSLSGVMWKTVSHSCNLACDYYYYSGAMGDPETYRELKITYWKNS